MPEIPSLGGGRGTVPVLTSQSVKLEMRALHTMLSYPARRWKGTVVPSRHSERVLVSGHTPSDWLFQIGGVWVRLKMWETQSLN